MWTKRYFVDKSSETFKESTVMFGMLYEYFIPRRYHLANKYLIFEKYKLTNGSKIFCLHLCKMCM